MSAAHGRPKEREDAQVSDMLLRASGLHVAVAGRTLCEGLDMAVRAGERWAILGLNGSGKTTLLHTLAGLRPAATGALEFGGRALPQWGARELARFRGLMPQDMQDAFPLTVLEAALVGRYPHQCGWGWEWWQERGEDLAAARGALLRVGLEALDGRDCATLSGGERRRVALAALFALAPRLYLLDEPTTHLDPHHQIALIEALGEECAARGCALIMSLHDPILAHRFCSHALLLFGDGQTLAGNVAQVLTAQNLSRAYRHPLHAHDTPDGRVFVAV